MYVIKRTDGAYVAPAGSSSSYTRALDEARIWRTREVAALELCPGNERIVPLDDCLSGLRGS